MNSRDSTFLLPSLIGLLGAVGLTAALFGDGWWDLLSWLGLGIPALLSIWPLLPRALRAETHPQRALLQPRSGPE